MKKLILIIVLSIVVVGGMFGYQYNAYVNNTESPYDEIGITLNGWMPGPIRSWGCGKLKATFGEVVPPYHCGAEDDPTAWAD